MDLTKQPPRRPTNFSVAGIVGVARMIDKARAHNEEMIGQYLYGSDSGLDRRILRFLGVSAQDFTRAVNQKDDSEIGHWVINQSKKTPGEIVAFNRSETNRMPKEDWHIELLKNRVKKYAPDRTDIKTVFGSIELDDWGTFWPVNLQVGPPRSPYDRNVAGLFGIARMADKARASRCEKNGDYKYGQYSPFDVYLLELLDIEAEQFQQIAIDNPNNLDLGEWILLNTATDSDRIATWNQQALNFGLQPASESKLDKSYLDYFNRENFGFRKNIVAPDSQYVQNWLDLMDYDDQNSFGILDLARRAPRSPYNRDAGGLVHLARLIDKGRAFNSKTLGGYWYGQDSAIDRYLLDFLKISIDEFTQQLQELPTDHQIVEWLMKRTPKNENQIEQYNQELVNLGPQNTRSWSFLHDRIQQLDSIISTRNDVETFFDLMVLSDQKTFQFP
ncbi:hypothetical protein CMK13_15065 [Candidatus Poribacteria bacterium]|nr:hypothetical protein [Candidatus Poribacteria bacterium]OUT57502.1 MAG: hypothetical protein CBB75_14430 [bacterium TMED15]